MKKNQSIYRTHNTFSIVSNRFQECLEITLPKFTLNYSAKTEEDFGEKILDCFGIMGIIDLINASYLIAITEVELSFYLFKKEIYKIKNVEFILLAATDQNGLPVNDYFTQGPNKEENEENMRIFEELRKVFANGFYFSNKYDLANSFSSHNQILASKNTSGLDYDQIIEGNRNFLANWKLIDRLILPNQKNNTRVFVSNCIYGNIESISLDIKGENDVNEKVQIIIISRRNLFNFSVSNFKKGLSINGLNSNLIETEVIMIHNNTDIYTHISLSSNIPIFFRNKSTYTQYNILKAFNKYFMGLIDEYKLLVMVGLSEPENDKNFFEIFRNFTLANINYLQNTFKYFCIDSHKKSVKNILKDSKSKGSNILEILGFSHNNYTLKALNDFFQIGTFYFFGLNEETIYDNQYFLTRKVLSNIFKKITKTGKKITKLDEFTEGLKIIFQIRKEQLISQYSPNKDYYSIISQQRMLELVFGKNIKNLKKDYRIYREEYAQSGTIKMFVGSWNVGSTDLDKHPKMNLDSWLIQNNQTIVPDIYVVGLQEVVELNAGNIVLNLEDKEIILLDWAKKIENSIQKIGNYKRLIAMNLVGINLYCYVLENEYDNINNLTRKYVKTGFGGAGNKGSCCINFNYLSSTISIACSHLAAGEKKNKQRLKEIQEILAQKISTFEKPSELNILIEENVNAETNNEVIHENENNDNLSYSFKDSDIWILFGDLNFRIDMDYDEFSQFITKGENWQKLLEYDQFNKNKKASIEFKEILDEDLIIHPPSYKYMIGSDSYDYDSKDKFDEDTSINNATPNTNLSGKKRNPSWCDRIFYKKNSFVTKDEMKSLTSLRFYNCVFDDNFQTSDHRPIFNIFDIIVFKDDEEKRKYIEKEVSFNNKLNITSSYFKTKQYAY